MSRVSLDEILELPPAERVAVVQEIWESMVAKPETVPITSAQREELERRWIAFQENPDEGETWDEVKTSLRRE
jgi:putative addiction module component (TIGR02574 family)